MTKTQSPNLSDTNCFVVPYHLHYITYTTKHSSCILQARRYTVDREQNRLSSPVVQR
jgi:hypothetical protein